MTPMKAIRAKCLDCSCGNANEVRLCPIKDCPLYDYRFGHNPARKGISGKGNSQFGKKISTDGMRSQDREEKQEG